MMNLIGRYSIPITLFIICLITLSLEPLSSTWLSYDRYQVDNNHQWWRIFTANLVHLGSWHTLLNMTSLWLISIIFRDLISLKDWGFWFLITFLGNIIGMHLWVTSLNSYVGMSGALYGIIAACAIAEFRLGVKISGLLLLLVGLKIFAPHILGVNSEYDEWLGGKVVEESHVIGYVQGLIIGLLWPKSRLKTPALSNKFGFKQSESNSDDIPESNKNKVEKKDSSTS